MTTNSMVYRAPRPQEDAAHLLVIDDDRRIRDLLRRYLSENGFRISVAENAAGARKQLDALSFDGLIIDVMMPGENGMDLARSLRETMDVPMIMLTAMSEVDDRIRGLEAGVDDYLPKPFEPKELLLRLGNILKRVPSDDETAFETVTFGAFHYARERQQLTKSGDPVRLTDREKQILDILSKKPGATVARHHLLTDHSGGERVIDVHINRLRRKLETDPANPAYLQTVRGVGYRLITDHAE